MQQYHLKHDFVNFTMCYPILVPARATKSISRIDKTKLKIYHIFLPSRKYN